MKYLPSLPFSFNVSSVFLFDRCYFPMTTSLSCSTGILNLLLVASSIVETGASEFSSSHGWSEALYYQKIFRNSIVIAVLVGEI